VNLSKVNYDFLIAPFTTVAFHIFKSVVKPKGDLCVIILKQIKMKETIKVNFEVGKPFPNLKGNLEHRGVELTNEFILLFTCVKNPDWKDVVNWANGEMNIYLTIAEQLIPYIIISHDEGDTIFNLNANDPSKELRNSLIGSSPKTIILLMIDAKSSLVLAERHLQLPDDVVVTIRNAWINQNKSALAIWELQAIIKLIDKRSNIDDMRRFAIHSLQVPSKDM
jgi:hypothetical protein